ncbi:hypothetical protein FRB98_006221 [Tulasnella sp. 332]|nr:hypothetical protein FRB98_006221 [Tulasnella sp. 332]
MATKRAPGTFSLKQKLSSLSLSVPSSSSPTTPTTPSSWSPLSRSEATSRASSSKVKNRIFGWARGKETEEQEDAVHSEDVYERVETVLETVICQAGVDYETRPMVVITAANLPDPQSISYDLLLSRILAHLDAYVENDYTVVFLTAGGKHTPGWNWVWKAYRSLDRKYRKNLKKLYIVHSSWFSKMLFSLAGAIIRLVILSIWLTIACTQLGFACSPKFFRKIQYVSTLSDLAEHVPLTQIDIAPAVYQENLKVEREITIPAAEHANVFGISLEILMGDYGEKGGIPRVVKDCVEFVRERGMEVEGIFRRSPNSALLRQAKEAYDRGHPVSLSSFSDPHIGAVLLKKFFRDLPEPIFHEGTFPIVQRCPLMLENNDDLATDTYIREQLLPALKSDAAEIVLSYVCHLLHDISLRASINLMDAHNLALCFCPTLVRSNPLQDLQMCSIPGGPSLVNGPTFTMPSSPSSDHGATTIGMVIKYCIEHYFDVFEEVIDRSEPLHSSNAAMLSRPEGPPQSQPSTSVSGSLYDEDDSVDDTMLVMSLGPTSPTSALPNPQSPGRSPPTAWRGRHRRIGSGNSSRSVIPQTPPLNDTVGSRRRGPASVGAGAMASSRNRASMISIEKAVTKNGTKSSIALGKGSMRRAGGAGVEAVNVTALGFFMPQEKDDDGEDTIST